MTWRSAICFSNLVLALAGMECPRLPAAGLTGRVQLIGSKDSAVTKRNDYSGVVVWLTSPDTESTGYVQKRVRMVQKNKKFSPHILAVETGTVVDFPNLDPIFHNAFSNFDGTIFDVALYPPGSSRAVRFDRPGIVRVFCNIHAFMSAIIVVVDSNLFTMTGQDGRYFLPNVPPGTYELHMFHERATPETLESLVRTVIVEDRTRSLDPIEISEADYLPVAHKNKYGRDYPPSGNEPNTYSPIR